MLSDESVAASAVVRRVAAILALIATTIISAHAAQNRPASPPGLTIIVIEGEDAVNVIEQKTAVAPIVEVRDHNNQPVAGATVRFAIEGGRAAFNGARTITLTTNAAGRAAATGFAPTGSGALQISASAAFEGQSVTVTIAQTNVMTAAQAASAAGAPGAGGTGSGAAAGGASGGISATTIGIAVGAAAVGGAIVAKQVTGGQGGVNVYEGNFRIDTLLTVQQAQPNGVIALTCTASLSQNGEVRAEIEEREDGTLTGTMSAKWTVAQLSTTCPFSSATNEEVSYGNAPVTGTAAGFEASSLAPSDGVGFGAQSFSGTLSNDVIRGTWTLGPGGYRGANGFGGASSPAGSTAVTLTK